MKYIFFFTVFLFCLSSIAQNLEFRGKILDNDSIPIPGASILLKKNQTIIAYGYTNESGEYSFSVTRGDIQGVILEVNSLGSKIQIRKIFLDDTIVYENDFVLENEVEFLSTVVIESDKKIDLKRDTIVYKVSSFTDKTERTVEDVLKKIPGIEIDNNGNIKAQGQNIQKILIEGDDLADSNYKIISQNLDAQVLDKVEVINNYDENPVLKQFLSSEGVVLNLKLQEKVKSVIFGSAEAGAGTQERYMVELNLGLIRPEIKLLNLGNTNNIGKTAGDQLNNYIFGQSGFNDFNEDIVFENVAPVDLNGSSIMIDDMFYIENKTISNSLLLNKTIKEKTKIRSSLIFYDELLQKESLSTFGYFVQPKSITYSEENSFTFNNINFKNDLEISHSFSDNDYLNFKNEFQILNEDVGNLLIFNNTESINQILDDRNIDFESNLRYTRKIKKGAAIFYLYLGSKNLDQGLHIFPSTFAEVPETEKPAFKSQNEATLNYNGFQSNFVFKRNRLSYSFTGNLMYLSETLNFHSKPEKDQKGLPEEPFTGDNHVKSFNYNVKIKAEYHLSKSTKLNGKTEIDHINYIRRKKTDFLVVNPSLSFSTRTKLGNFSLSYSNYSELPRLINFIRGSLVKNYRSLYSGTEEIDLINSNRYSLAYTFSRPEKRILLTSSISYIDYNNQITHVNYLSEDLNVFQSQYVSGQNLLLFNSGFTTFVDKLNTTFKVGFTHSFFKNPAIINNREVLIENSSGSFYLRGTSYFRGLYNFKFSLASNFTRGEILGNEVNKRFYNFNLENVFKFSDRFFGNFKNEIFLIDSELYESSAVNFEYRPERSDWVYGLRAQNILNTQKYVFTNISNFQQSETIFKAIPAYFLMYAKVRF